MVERYTPAIETTLFTPEATGQGELRKDHTSLAVRGGSTHLHRTLDRARQASDSLFTKKRYEDNQIDIELRQFVNFDSALSNMLSDH